MRVTLKEHNMESTRNSKTPNRNFAKGVKIAGGFLLFAFLMGIRDEFSELWVGVLLAGVAFGILSLVIVQCFKKRS